VRGTESQWKRRRKKAGDGQQNSRDFERFAQRCLAGAALSFSRSPEYDHPSLSKSPAVPKAAHPLPRKLPRNVSTSA
jgi:hypothetical protein